MSLRHPQKVFIGLESISTMLPSYVAGFHALGIPTLTAATNRHVLRGGVADYIVDEHRVGPGDFSDTPVRYQLAELSRQESLTYIRDKALAECDLFLFIWSTFAPDRSDLELLKERGKKVICIFCGDDVRWPPAMEQEFARYGLRPIGYDREYLDFLKLEHRLLPLRRSEQFADLIVSNPNNMQTALRPYFGHRIPLEFDLLRGIGEQRAVPRVVHAPTSRSFKGTSWVLRAFDELRSEGVAFEPILVEGKSAPEAYKIYREADIVLDQVLCPGGGKVSLEGLAMGKVVVTLHAREYYQPHSDALPFVDASSHNLKEVLRSLIPDLSRRQALAASGPSAVAHHEPATVCRDLIKALEVQALRDEIIPRFFRELFVPESRGAQRVYNEMTRWVSSCSWYKERVPSGVRSGLEF